MSTATTKAVGSAIVRSSSACSPMLENGALSSFCSGRWAAFPAREFSRLNATWKRCALRRRMAQCHGAIFRLLRPVPRCDHLDYGDARKTGTHPVFRTHKGGFGDCTRKRQDTGTTTPPDRRSADSAISQAWEYVARDRECIACEFRHGLLPFENGQSKSQLRISGLFEVQRTLAMRQCSF